MADISHRILLWDLPLRIFHWSLVVAVSTAIATGLAGGEWMVVHGRAGLVITGLLAFRIVWGLIGSRSAQFASFFPTPARLLSYVKGQWQGVGHNPLGALSVIAMLLLLSIQVVTGLVGNDDISFTGPLASLIDEARSYQMTGLHHQLSNVLYALLGLHVAAIVFYVRIKKHALLGSMVHGYRDVATDTPKPAPARPWKLLVAILLALTTVYAASGAWIEETPAPPAQPAQATPAW